MPIIIETGIPFPKNGARGESEGVRELKEALARMQSGNSFLYDKSKKSLVRYVIDQMRKSLDDTEKKPKFVWGESAQHETKIRIWKR